MARSNKKSGSGKIKSQHYSKANRDMFLLPKAGWMALILIPLAYMIITTVAPETLPGFLGPITAFGQFMGFQHHNLCVLISFVALFLHCLEAAYTAKVCHDRGYSVPCITKWTVSTFIFGFPSLLQLKQVRSQLKNS